MLPQLRRELMRGVCETQVHVFLCHLRRVGQKQAASLGSGPRSARRRYRAAAGGAILPRPLGQTRSSNWWLDRVSRSVSTQVDPVPAATARSEASPVAPLVGNRFRTRLTASDRADSARWGEPCGTLVESGEASPANIRRRHVHHDNDGGDGPPSRHPASSAWGQPHPRLPLGSVFARSTCSPRAGRARRAAASR
jgi:hypothetical protein